MKPIKVAVIYYSSTGTNYQIAQAMSEAAEQAGAEVRLRKVPELVQETIINENPAWKAHAEATRHIAEATLDDLDWADVYLFGSPTRFGNVTSQFKQFIDTTGPLWMQGKLSNKVAAGFTSASNPHGGQESTLLAMYNMLYHWGCFIVPPGYTDDTIYPSGGNPYGLSVTATGQDIPEANFAAAKHSARRAVQVAQWIAAGRELLESPALQQDTAVMAE